MCLILSDNYINLIDDSQSEKNIETIRRPDL